MCTIYGVLLHFTIFCCQISFFCNLRCFVAKSVLVRFTRFCVEKNLAKNCARGEKMTNMRYVHVVRINWDLCYKSAREGCQKSEHNRANI